MAGSASEDNVFMASTNNSTAGARATPSNGSDRASGFGSASSRLDVSDTSQRRQQFRRLVSDIAEHLDKNDVHKIIWQKELPKKMKDNSPLNVLEYLHSRGEFTATELRPLSQLLQAINREDLTGKVDSYHEKFGRHASLPLNSPKPRPKTEKRANTLTEGQSFTQITDTNSNEVNPPHQETAGSDKHDSQPGEVVNTTVPPHSTLRSTSNGPVEESILTSDDYSAQQQFPDQEPGPLSHDLMQDLMSLLSSQPESPQKKRILKQMSYEQIEPSHVARVPMSDTQRMHRSNSSNTTTSVAVRTLDSHSLGSSVHDNISSLPAHHSIIGQPAWRFNSNPSSGNVSQENMLLASSHSDVNVSPVYHPRMLTRPHMQQPLHHNHQRAYSNSHVYALEQRGASPFTPHSPGSRHTVNQHQLNPASFSTGHYIEDQQYATRHGYLPMPHIGGGGGGRTLSQSSCCQLCTMQPCVCQHDSLHASQEHVVPTGVHNHYRQGSGTGFNSGAESRCNSRASTKLQTVVQPPQSFPTAYPSCQNIANQPMFSMIAQSHQPPTRHLSLIAPGDHHQTRDGQRFSGYTTDGSGDEVFHTYSGEHLATAPERSSTHPLVANGASKAIKSRVRTSQDHLGDRSESTTSKGVSPGHSRGGGSEISMETAHVGPGAITDKSNSKHVWDMLSHSGELNDSDSGFNGSASHGINGDSGRRSFTPSTNARIRNELKKLPQSPPPTFPSNGGCSSHAAELEALRQTKQLAKKKSSSANYDQENDADIQSDDNIPVVYKDDENDERWKKRKGRAIVRGAVQYTSLRYDRDKKIHRRKPTRNSLQSFDGNTLDSLDATMKAKNTAGQALPGLANGSAHSLKSKSSEDNIASSLAALHHQRSREDKVSTSANSKQSKAGMNVKSKSTHSNSSNTEQSSDRAGDTSDSPSFAPHLSRETVAFGQKKKSWYRRSKPQAKLIKPHELVWPIKRDKLNKYIYETKYTKKSLICKHKLELETGIHSGPRPKLKLELHPYGLEEDRNENVTITVHVERPKNCDLHSSTEIRISLSVLESDTGELIGQQSMMDESIRSSYFLVKKFVSHESIKKSRCDFVEVYVQACLVAGETV